MNPTVKIPVSLQRVYSVETSIADIQDRIAKRAYDKFLERGSTSGFELQDWLSAETEMIIFSRAGMREDGEHAVAEIYIPNVEPSILDVSVTPNEVFITSAPDEAGRQVFQTVRFPEEIDLTDVRAEHVLDTLFITAAISRNLERTLRAIQVA